jgi:hypothetical protein
VLVAAQIGATLRHISTLHLQRRTGRALRSFVLLGSFAIGAGVGSGCSSTATADIKVRSAADAKANLEAYRSFAWYESGGLLQDRTGVWVDKDMDTKAEVEFLVDQKLRNRGLAVAPNEPDLLVSLLLVADVKDVEEIKVKRGEALTTFDPVGKGALIVELIDAETGKTVWMGGAEGEVRGSRTIEESKERLAYAVDKLFEKFPD